MATRMLEIYFAHLHRDIGWFNWFNINIDKISDKVGPVVITWIIKIFYECKWSDKKRVYTIHIKGNQASIIAIVALYSNL